MAYNLYIITILDIIFIDTIPKYTGHFSDSKANQLIFILIPTVPSTPTRIMAFFQVFNSPKLIPKFCIVSFRSHSFCHQILL